MRSVSSLVKTHLSEGAFTRQAPEARTLFEGSASRPMALRVIRDLSENERRCDLTAERTTEILSILEEDLEITHRFDEIVGESSGLKCVLKQVENVVVTDATVLILGETGTRKELIARAIHELSPCRENCLASTTCGG